MTLDEVLASLFPAGHEVTVKDGLIGGKAALVEGGDVHVLGIDGGKPLGIDDALTLAGRVLDIIKANGDAPILVLIDSSSQRMSRRDELLGLNEYLAHLAKALLLAEAHGHNTASLLYGGSEAGAFIVTALATGHLIAVPGAHPAVMDLPSMARITKLPIDVLRAKAKTTPVFAPGVDNLVRIGAVEMVWDDPGRIAEQLAVILDQPSGPDARDQLGAERGGRTKAASIAARVEALACHE